MPFDNQVHTTQKGKVVYKRKTHKFNLTALDRIITKINNDTTLETARMQNNAVKIRSIFTVASSLYAMVSDMFDKPVQMDDNSYYVLKKIWRDETDEIIGMISSWVAIRSGIDELGDVVNTIGRMINRGMEYLITGHTDY